MSETAVLWVMGAVIAVLSVALGICFRMLTEHTRDCTLWRNQFLVEHGALKANVDRLLRVEDER